MATKKDLVEAHAFSRRRLVTAFVSGAPGGREVEPARPGRVIIGGLALSVLLIAGAAIAGIFIGKAPEDWAQPGLFISKSTGAAYVITEDAEPAVLRPVANITSAKLILGAGTEPTMMDQDAINSERVGEEIGILFAPAAPPAAAELLNTGWTACSGTGQGIRLTLTSTPGATGLTGAGMVVKAGQRFFLLAQSSATLAAKPGTFAYELPRNAGVRDNILSDLGLRSSSYASTVSDRFLSLLPAGGALAFESMGISGAGDRPTYAGASGIPRGARVGDILTIPGGASVVLTAEGPADLSPFALAVYSNLNQGFVPQQLTSDQALGAGRVRAPYAAANWPDSALVPNAGDPCLVLDARAGSAPVVVIASNPTAEASARGVAGRRVSVRVEAGHGAYVASGNWDAANGGTPFMIDGTGKTFELEGDDTADRLDFAEVTPPAVPDTWVELFEPGVTLAPDAALCPARPRDAGATSCE